MSEIYLRPISNSNGNVKTQNLNTETKVETPSMKKINNQIKANGTKEIGKKALEKSLQELSKMLEGRNIKVGTTFDAKSGLQQVSITDGTTGKTIAQLPTDAAVEMAEKSRHQHIGWLLDRLV